MFFLLWDSKLFIPIKYFVILMHEINHSIAAIITGGYVIDITIDSNLGAQSRIEGGNIFLISSAGYLGSFLSGALLFYSANNKKLKTFSVICISSIIFLFSTNTIKNSFWSLTFTISSILLIITIKFLPEIISCYMLKLLGFSSCIYILFDIKKDVFNNNYISDAKIISEASGLSVEFWGFIWLLITLIGLILLIKITYKNIR